MKKVFKILILTIILVITGCMNNKSMEDIVIYTTNYPIEYLTKQLYEKHSTIKSIYPSGVNVAKYKISDALIGEYKDNDLYIFNSLTTEKEYVSKMRKNNKNLKIIDVTSDLAYNYSVEELWLDPSNILGLANNIRKGFKEYIISNPVLVNEIEDNYQNLKYNLTSLESKYRDELNEYKDKTIVISDDMFMFFEKYGLKVLSLDENNENYDSNLKTVKSLINSGKIEYIFVPDIESDNEIIDKLNIEKIKLNTLQNITEEQKENYDYVNFITENLEAIKKQLNR